MLEIPQITTEEENEEFLRFVGENVKRIREERGYSQLETALSIGQKSQGFYACMEKCSNKKHFNLIHLFKLSKFFGVKIEAFFQELAK